MPHVPTSAALLFLEQKMPDRNWPEWYKPRGYLHIDRPISVKAAKKLVSNPISVAHHAFLPFIRYEVVERRYKSEQHQVVNKVRPIAFSSHRDSHIFSYYASSLRAALEKKIDQEAISESVLAYRRFEGGKCNIHFANDAFNEIRNRGNCIAIGMDVEGFFDNLNHRILKDAWCWVMEVKSLPEDMYQVFRAITKFATVEQSVLYDEFGIGRDASRRKVGSICSVQEFRERVRAKGHVSVNRNPYGIPQGSPISAVLANAYMCKVDSIIVRFAESIGGVYRRYSDDILLVCDENNVERFEQFVLNALKDVKLSVNAAKTVRAVYKLDRHGVLSCPRPLQYLGFVFDGQRRLIRSRTIAKYKRRIRQALKSSQRAAIKSAEKGAGFKIKRRKLYERFSHLGRRNFISYAYRASEIMKDKAARRQVRRHWKDLNQSISSAGVISREES